METFTSALDSTRAAYIAADSATRVARLRDAIVWARFTIQTRTDTAERLISAWIDDGRPLTIGHLPGGAFLARARQETIAAMYGPDAISDDTLTAILAIAPRGDGAAETQLASIVPGIAIVKASFALASSGAGRLGCVDGLGADLHSATILNHFPHASGDARKTLSNLTSRARARGDAAEYVFLARTLWGVDSAAGQWAEWLAARADEGRATSHDCLARLGA